jgi:Uncharacterized protein conserved in bacteria (DUF2188)
MAASLHVVQRSDGIWQIEHEDDLVPVSLHETQDAALDAALAMARREHRSLTLHRNARRPVSWADRVARALLSRDLAGGRRRAG